jgi:hypothetical protein
LHDGALDDDSLDARLDDLDVGVPVRAGLALVVVGEVKLPAGAAQFVCVEDGIRRLMSRSCASRPGCPKNTPGALPMSTSVAGPESRPPSVRRICNSRSRLIGDLMASFGTPQSLRALIRASIGARMLFSHA